MPGYENIELLGDLIEDELAGDDDDEMMGAIAVPSRYRRLRRSNMVQRAKRAYMNKLAPAVPGVVPPGARNFPLGFGSFAFVNGGATTAILTASPQRPFKGRRLVIDVKRTANALGELVTITGLTIGANDQRVAATALPAEAFLPGAFGVDLSLDPATPGIDITLELAISAAPGAGESVTVSPMLIGDTVG